jgi:hypothetical protein
MAHRQGLIATDGLIGGIARSTASGVLSAHTSTLHDEDCTTLVQGRRAPLFARLRRLASPARPASVKTCDC